MTLKNSSLHLLTEFDKNYNIWVSCKCRSRGCMKIQPISINTFSKTSSVKRKEVKSSIVSVKSNNSYISDSFYYPLNFTAQKKRTFKTDKTHLAERSGDFLVSEISDIPCPSCGKLMLNQEKFEQISRELANLPPEEYLDCLGKYTEYMRPVEESVYNEIQALSQKDGYSTDIRELLVELRDKKMPILQEAQMRQIKKMRSLANTLPEDEKAVLKSKIKSLQHLIHKNNAQAPFRRKIMIDRISKVKIRNPNKYEALQTIAKNFPTSSDMNSAWIVKYSGKNKHNEDWESYDIALRFLSSSVANTDHIVAYDIDDNHDDISNYMSMHSACNSQKGNKPFLQWLYEDKENRIKYMQAYFDTVHDLVKADEIKSDKYEHYVAYATKTIYDASKGQVLL